MAKQNVLTEHGGTEPNRSVLFLYIPREQGEHEKFFRISKL